MGETIKGSEMKTRTWDVVFVPNVAWMKREERRRTNVNLLEEAIEAFPIKGKILGLVR